MALSDPRYKILPLRGTYAALNAEVSNITEGEICYATDQDQYYQKEGGALVAVGPSKAEFDETIESLEGIQFQADSGYADFGFGNDDLIILEGGTAITTLGNGRRKITFDLDDTTVTPAAYGASGKVGSFTVDQQGRLTAAADVDIQISQSQVTGLTEDLANLAPSTVNLQAVTDNGNTTTNGAVFGGPVIAGSGSTDALLLNKASSTNYTGITFSEADDPRFLFYVANGADGDLILQKRKDGTGIKNIFKVANSNGAFDFRVSPTFDGHKIWHANNDGTGSGLDADLLDGQEGSFYRDASNLNAGIIPQTRIENIGEANAQIVKFANLEKASLTEDGQLAFDSSQGLLVYRTQQGAGGSATTVLDGWNVEAGDGISITNLGAGDNGTQQFTFSVNQGAGSGLDADLLDGIEASAFVKGNGDDNGSVIIEITDADFIVRDSTDTPTNYLWRDHSSSKLFLGSSAAVPTTREPLLHDDGTQYWYEGNDGTGSGLDADLLDGQEGSYYLNYTSNNMSNIVGSWHTFNNDGGGNVGQRWNSTPGGSNNLVENGHAWELGIGNDSTAGFFTLHRGTSTNGLSGEAITWAEAVSIDENLDITVTTVNGLSFSAPIDNTNVVVGADSLSAATGGSHNIAIGNSALLNLATESNNVAIGGQALLSSVDGNTNVAIGKFAMAWSAHGARNTAVGYGAMRYADSTGTAKFNTSNTAIGWQALRGSTTPANNTGKQNTAVGHNSMVFTTSGSDNTACGLNALYTNQSGNQNVAVGRNALYSNTIGSNNAAIGFEAGRYTTGGTAATSRVNCAYLGYNTRTSGNNQVQLGDANTTTYAYGAVQDRSDARDKTDVRDTLLGLEFINSLRPVDFRWDMRDFYYDHEAYEIEEVETREIPNPAYVPEFIEEEVVDPETSELTTRQIPNPEYTGEPLTIEEEYTVKSTETRLVSVQKDGSRARSRFHHGLIAQEVKAAADAQGVDFAGYQDHSVNGGDDILSVGYTELIAPLIKAVQELSAENADLKARLDALEGA